MKKIILTILLFTPGAISIALSAGLGTAIIASLVLAVIILACELHAQN